MQSEPLNGAPARQGSEIEALVERATEGDRDALDALLRAIQGDVHNLAVRMLGCPEDAADATQEILMKVVTRLATFRRQSAFRTWVYRVATNHLLNVRKSRVEREQLTFSAFATDLATGLADPPARAASEPDGALLEEEVKIGCTQAMLLCLDRDHRVAYILGDVFELSSDDASAALDIPATAYRKRLSRARERLREFMRGHCGLVNPDRPCRCERRITRAIAVGRVRPAQLAFAGRPSLGGAALDVAREVGEMEDLHRIAGIYQSHPDYAAPERVLGGIRKILNGEYFSLLQ
jgi:RNA polymerase sigma factor (sigma-70 family)